MNRSENPTAVNILELMVKNPYNTNIPLEEFYRVINHFYGADRTEFDEALKLLDEQKIVEFTHTPAGDIETVVAVTKKGDDFALFLIPLHTYGLKP